MQDTLTIIGLAVSSIQLMVATVAAIYVSLQLRTMKEQTRSLAIQATNMAVQTGLLKDEQATMVTMERQKKSFEFITRFNSEEMIKLRHDAVVVMQKQGKLKDNETHALIAYLNFFEEMAMAILSQLANEELCKQYFHNIILTTCNASEEAFKENPGRYSSLQKLRLSWL